MKKIKEKNVEVEIRARISDIDLFRDTLEKYGAEFITSIHIYDVYFCKKIITNIQDVEMDEVGSYSLRIRKIIEDNKKESVTLNTKSIISHGDHNAWEEHEVSVDNFIEMTKILYMTEFKPFFNLEKTRYIYRINDMEVCVEDITDFGGAVEIEVMCELGDKISAKKKIKEFLQKCNIDEDSIVHKSITNLIMKERAFKQKKYPN